MGFKLGIKDLIKPRNIIEYVSTFGMMKCLKSIKKIIKKLKLKIIKSNVVILTP